MPIPTLLARAGLLLITSLSLPVIAAEPLLWAGCGITKKAFMSELAAAYQRETGVAIVLEGGGATKGIRRISEQSVHIGGTCRPKLADNDAEAYAELVPVAWDALVVIVHPDNPVADLSLQQLRDLYDGKITNWKQLGGADAPVDLLVRKGKISGVGLTLRELVFSDPDHRFVSKHVYPSSGPLEKAVEANPNAVGVTGISSALKRAVKLLSLEGKAPHYDSVRSGEYLLYRPLYIAFNAASERRAEVKRFIDFAHSRQGREIIRNAGTVPYLEALRLVHKQREQWKAARDAGS
ncbi:MAG: phosphate ABC transporter substrate-binding protein [Gammaproteobacteria bacterium]|nr:phosphate ABC transporter substrate-binding protein [Gammaproteobacteria bacterium]